MTTFSRAPRVRQGAIIALDIYNPLASVIVFQYNPAEVSRTVTARMGEAGGARSEALGYKGPPEEKISLKVAIDAADQLQQGERTAARMGIYPQLSALEMILYPKSALVIANALLSAFGTLEVVPPQAPLTLLVWGVKRVLPVRLSSLNITEQMYDADLNPIRAEVSMDLQVLTYDDLPRLHPGSALFMAHQVAKETMATLAGANTMGEEIGSQVRDLV